MTADALPDGRRVFRRDAARGRAAPPRHRRGRLDGSIPAAMIAVILGNALRLGDRLEFRRGHG